MKILHLPLWAPNKNDVQLGNFIQHHISLSGQQHEIHSVEFIAAEDCNEIVLFEKEKVSQISYPKSSFKIINFFRYIRAAKLAVNHLKKIGFYPDIVHCHVAGRNLWMANKYFPTVPKVISEHWSGYINGNFKKSNYFVKKFMIHQMNRCDAVTSVSEHLKTSLLEHGIDSNVTLLNNVIKYKEKSMVSASGDMIFLMVADLLDEVKNVSGAIEAINQLTHDHSCFKLMIIGDGPDMVFLRKQVERNNLESKIHFLGRLIQDDVQDYLLQADCLIVNSNYETYSMVTIESILTGCPVIATRCGGPEQFVNSKNGILIPKADIDQLKLAMIEIYQNRLNYQPDKVRGSVQGVYTEAEVESELNKIYLKLI